MGNQNFGITLKVVKKVDKLGLQLGQAQYKLGFAVNQENYNNVWVQLKLSQNSHILLGTFQ